MDMVNTTSGHAQPLVAPEMEILRTLRRPAVTVEFAGKALGVCRRTAYLAVQRGDIPSYRIGRRIMVPAAKLRQMLGMSEITA